MYTSWNDHKFFADFIVSNLVIIGIIVWLLATQKLQNRMILLGYGSLLLLYDLFALYYNYKYLHWYSTQINMTIIYLFFILLVAYQPSFEYPGQKESFVRFIIHVIVISSVAALIYHLMQYERLIFRNWNLYAIYPTEGYYENRFSWMFDHKSEYGFMLMVFLAFFIRFCNQFKNKIRFVGCTALLLVCLMLTHCWTDVAGAMLIIASAICDEVRRRKKLFTKKNTFILGGFIVAGIVLLRIIVKERDIFSAGLRTWIWKASVQAILANPRGCGKEMLNLGVHINEGWIVNNCHNYFLNEMFRYSIVVGIISSIMLLGIFAIAIYKNRNFFVVGTVVALLIALNMDYCLLIQHMALFVFVFYLTFIHEKKEKYIFNKV